MDRPQRRFAFQILLEAKEMNFLAMHSLCAMHAPSLSGRRAIQVTLSIYTMNRKMRSVWQWFLGIVCVYVLFVWCVHKESL